MKYRKKIYREGYFHHLFLKARHGNVIFYKTEDYLFYYTLYSVLVRKYQIKAEAFCIMFNHTHSCQKARSRGRFLSFCRDLQSIFTIGYTKEYRLEGPLMMTCGYVPKAAGKHHRSCLIYIANNAPAGKLVKNAIDYKWDLLAFFKSDHPFSDKLVIRKTRFAMKQAVKLVDWCFERNQFLNYTILRRLFDKLNSKEKSQLTDYIIIKYFFIDKASFISHFGDFSTTMIAIDSSAGSEDDFYEAWEDYSVYFEMLKTALKTKVDIKHFRFHEMDHEERTIIKNVLSRIPGATQKHIRRFLHLVDYHDKTQKPSPWNKGMAKA